MKVLDEREFVSFLAEKRASASDPGLVKGVARILEDVRSRGDAALVDYLRQFDGVELDPASLEVSPEEFDSAYAAVDEATLEAIRYSVGSVTEFHRNTRTGFTRLYPSAGGLLGRVYRALPRAGLYIPGGRKPYVSTVVMTAVPASVAGVGCIVACTPPRRDGSVDPHVAVACREAGVDRLFKVGGAQAVAAMAYGTDTVPRVDKIAGPGNRYVTAAKRLVFGDAGIDTLAGPSEVAIIADDSANASWLALDLLAQAEHGADSVAVLFTPSRVLLRTVTQSIDAEAGSFGRDAPSVVGVLTESVLRAVDLANELAPEHLQVAVEDPVGLLPLIRAAGAVLLGDYAPAALGDYVAGPSHVLPTGGASRFSSGLTADDFLVSSSVIYITPECVGPAVDMGARLADIEGFTYHACALRARTGD
ncbi:MAG: histidinol dehydrogenase [Firmicutes bacterium]|nr:histidinol dehydrogenase [Bacillota bacterium]